MDRELGHATVTILDMGISQINKLRKGWHINIADKVALTCSIMHGGSRGLSDIRETRVCAHQL